MWGLQRTELIISNLLQDNKTQAGDITGGHRTDLVVVTLTLLTVSSSPNIIIILNISLENSKLWAIAVSKHLFKWTESLYRNSLYVINILGIILVVISYLSYLLIPALPPSRPPPSLELDHKVRCGEERWAASLLPPGRIFLTGATWTTLWNSEETFNLTCNQMIIYKNICWHNCGVQCGALLLHHRAKHVVTVRPGQARPGSSPGETEYSAAALQLCSTADISQHQHWACSGCCLCSQQYLVIVIVFSLHCPSSFSGSITLAV